MLILGIETATDRVGCAIADSSGVRAAIGVTRPRHHAELLAPQVQTLCRQAGVTLRDVTAVAVDTGPGLYTGLRVGVTTARTMAHALGVEVIGVSSLDVVAFGLRHTRRRVVSVIDARRGEVFWAAYEHVDGRGVRRLTDPAVASPPEAASRVAQLVSAAPGSSSGDGLLLAGDGALQHAGAFAGIGGATIADPSLAHPSAESLVLLACLRAGSDRAQSPHEIKPLYLRRPDARPVASGLLA